MHDKNNENKDSIKIEKNKKKFSLYLLLYNSARMTQASYAKLSF